MFALPIVTGAFATGVAAIAAGTATFAAYATVAGTVLGGIGLLTDNKDISRLGGVLSLAGGLADSGMFGGGDAGGAAAESAAKESFRTSELLADKAAEASGTGGMDFMAGQGASGVANGASANFDAGQAVRDFGSDAINPGAQQTAGNGSLWDKAQGMAGNNGAESSLLGANPTNVNPLSTDPTGALGGGYENANPYVQQQIQTAGKTSAMQRAASETTGNDVSSYIKKALKANSAPGGSTTGLGAWVRDNKELVSLGGQMLQGMYGPQAEELDYYKKIAERRRANLNSPVRVAYTGV